MEFKSPVTELILKRYSCRSYSQTPLSTQLLKNLTSFCESTRVGPLGGAGRFRVVAAREEDASSLKGLGTYGFIRGATAYIIGATSMDERYLEDFGFMMERIILYATDQELGTCWLGGSFTKSSFSRRMGLEEGEVVPCVTSTGYPAKNPSRIEKFIRKQASSDRRLPWNMLFFEDNFDTSIERTETGGYQQVLEMVRKAPSASNRQPWRIVRCGPKWHFYLQRTPGYRTNRITKLTTTVDLQRIDMGIAMCHFELTARELYQDGAWVRDEPGIMLPNDQLEYSVTWIEAN